MTLNISRQATLFSLKNFLAGMLALYIALRSGLENPAWSVVTAYIVAQPHAGATVSKGVYRMCGTFAGACASVFMVPPLVQTPALLLLAIAAWLALCVFLQLVDRTARGYMFVLAGYTSCIIIFPILSHPDDVFEYASARFLEISLGIVCSTVVHAVVFPVSTTRIVRQRVDRALADAQALAVAALTAASAEPAPAPDRQKLAATFNELYDLLVHQRFEGPHAREEARAIRATLTQVERVLPLSLAVADRSAELVALGGLPAPVRAFMDEARDWFAAGEDPAAQLAAMEPLLARAAALRPVLDAPPGWREALLCNLLERIAELIRLKGAILRYRQAAASGFSRGFVSAAAGGSAWRPMERDLRGAAGAALAVAVTLLVGNALWIESGWTQGYSAAMMAGVYFSVYSATPNPAQMLKNKFVGVFLRLLLGALYVVLILPAISDFGAMVLAFAPALLASGLMMAMPRFSAMGFNFVVGVMSPSIVDRTFHTDFELYLNAGIATLTGIYFAMLMVSVTRFLWLDGLVRRTLAAGRRDIARMRYLSPREQLRWRGRMIHRIGLLVLRMAAAPGPQPAEALRDLMVGGALLELHQASRKADAASAAAMRELIGQVAAYYQTLERTPTAAPPPALRQAIDACLARIAATLPVDEPALLALTSLRRNLFPADHSVPAALPAPG